MNAYDFDKTIFYPDSSVTFVRWIYRKYPLLALRCLPISAFYGLLYLLKLVPKEKLKEKAFYFVRFLDDIDEELRIYWDEHESWICKWYLRQRRDDDIIISASPQFVIRPMSERMGFKLIATPMDKKTGIIHGCNCHGEEKVRRLREECGDVRIENFYSDSLTDTPMAKIADKAWLIVDKGQTPVPWEF